MSLPVKRQVHWRLEFTRFASSRAPLHEEVATRVELLNAVIPRINDVHVVVCIDGDGLGIFELSRPRPVCPPGGKDLARWRQLLDSVVSAVHYIDITLGVESQARRTFELGRFTPLSSPLLQWPSLARKLLDAGGFRLRYIDIPVLIDGNAAGAGELSGIDPRLSPRGKPFASRRKLLDAIMALVHDIEITPPINGQKSVVNEHKARNCARPRWWRHPPALQELTCRGELEDNATRIIRNVDDSGGVHCDHRRLKKARVWYRPAPHGAQYGLACHSRSMCCARCGAKDDQTANADQQR